MTKTFDIYSLDHMQAVELSGGSDADHDTLVDLITGGGFDGLEKPERVTITDIGEDRVQVESDEGWADLFDASEVDDSYHVAFTISSHFDFIRFLVAVEVQI